LIEINSITSIDKTAIIWTIAIVAIGVGIAGYGMQSVTTMQPDQTTSETVKQSETEIVQELVSDSINLYDIVGDDAFEQINTDDKFRNGDIYVFVLDKQGFRVAHGGNPDLIGLQTMNFPNNKIRDTILDSANEDGVWVKCQRALSYSHIVHTKNSFVMEYDNLIFGSGYYVEDRMASEKDLMHSTWQNKQLQIITLMEYLPFLILIQVQNIMMMNCIYLLSECPTL